MQSAGCGARFDQTVPEDSVRISLSAGESPWRQSQPHNSTWLPAALLATLVLLASALQAFGDQPQQLQWRPARTPAQKKPTAPRSKAIAQPVRHATGRQGEVARYAVVQAAYEEDGWSSTANQDHGSARAETLIVHPRDPQFEGTGPAFRVAQDPFENDELTEELSRDINQPFGEMQQPGELPDAGIDELPDPTEPELFDEEQLDSEPAPLPLDDDVFDDRAPADEETVQPGVPAPTLPRPYGERREQPRFTDLQEQALQRRETTAAENCEELLEAVRQDTINNIDVAIEIVGREGWDYPFECSIDDGSLYAGRHWPEVTYMWKAAANCHKPLYFEQVHLERYGHSWGPCVQPLISGAHFFTRLPVLPYCMGITPPNECIYPLGYYRPGNCAPYMIDAVPFTWRAAAFQAGATVGTAAVLP